MSTLSGYSPGSHNQTTTSPAHTPQETADVDQHKFKYTITRKDDFDLEWSPGRGTFALATALNFHFPTMNSLEEKMQAAIARFVEDEERKAAEHLLFMQTGSKDRAPHQTTPPFSGPTLNAPKGVIGASSGTSRHSVTLTEPILTPNTPNIGQLRSSAPPNIQSFVTVFPAQNGLIPAPPARGRKGPLTAEQKKIAKINRKSKAVCSVHKSARVACNPEKCPENKLYQARLLQEAKKSSLSTPIKQEQSSPSSHNSFRSSVNSSNAGNINIDGTNPQQTPILPNNAAIPPSVLFNNIPSDHGALNPAGISGDFSDFCQWNQDLSTGMDFSNDALPPHGIRPSHGSAEEFYTETTPGLQSYGLSKWTMEQSIAARSVLPYRHGQPDATGNFPDELGANGEVLEHMRDIEIELEATAKGMDALSIGSGKKKKKPKGKTFKNLVKRIYSEISHKKKEGSQVEVPAMQ